MYRVLIADDEPYIIDGLKKLFDWEKHDLQIYAVAANGSEALQIIKKERIDILITDIRMPEVSGLDLIRHIAEKGLNIKCIILSGYDDFKYVKEAAKLGIEDYLLKPVDYNELILTLKNTIRKIESELYAKTEMRQRINILRDNILNRLVTNDININDFREKASIIEFDTEPDGYIPAVINFFHSAEHETLSKISERNLLQFSICNICNELLENNGILFCDLDGDIIVIFYVNDNFSDTDIKAVLVKCTECINKFLGTNVFITVGSFEESVRNIHTSYSGAKSIQPYRLIMPENCIMYYDTIAANMSSATKSYTQIDYKSLNDCILSKDISGFQEIIDRLFIDIQNKKDLDPSSVYDFVIHIFINIYSTLSTLNPILKKYLDDNSQVYENLFKNASMKQIKSWLLRVISKSIDIIKAEEESMSPIINKIVKYLQENYTEDINLKSVASKFNINPVYLGRLFKNETGELFNIYLNRVRIEKAKELLLTSNLKANEISRLVGYSNINYFYTLFKKYTGVSSSDYCIMDK